MYYVRIHDCHTVGFDPKFFLGLDCHRYSSRNIRSDCLSLSLHIIHEMSVHTRNECLVSPASPCKKYNFFSGKLRPLSLASYTLLLPFWHVPCCDSLLSYCQLSSENHYLVCLESILWQSGRGSCCLHSGY